MQTDKNRPFAKECVINNSEIFLMKTCLNLANSTFNLYVLYINLAQNTKQFRRTSLLSFISKSAEKAFNGLRPWGFGLLNISPPLIQHATSTQYVKYGITYTAKAFAGTLVGMIF